MVDILPPLWYPSNIMQIIRKNLIKDGNACYVVTRDGRRVEDINYKTQGEAEERAYHLQEMLKAWDPNNSRCVSILYTSKPHRVF